MNPQVSARPRPDVGRGMKQDMSPEQLEASRRERLTNAERQREQPEVIDGVRVWRGPIPVAPGTLVISEGRLDARNLALGAGGRRVECIDTTHLGLGVRSIYDVLEEGRWQRDERRSM